MFFERGREAVEVQALVDGGGDEVIFVVEEVETCRRAYQEERGLASVAHRLAASKAEEDWEDEPWIVDECAAAREDCDTTSMARSE